MKTIMILFWVFMANMSHAADWSSRSSVQLGTTSNANFDKDAPVSDSYVKVSNTAGLQREPHSFGFRLSYVDYVTESQNDAFSFGLSNIFSPSRIPWKYTGALVGNVYTSTSPGTTDSSFTNYGIDLKANRNLSVTSRQEVEIGGGYRIRTFPSLDGRNDHSVFGLTSVDFDVNSQTFSNLYGELGLTVSSLSDYSRFYLDLGGSVEYEFSPQLTWTNDVSISRSAFTSRTVSTTTIVDQRRGNRVSGTLVEHETYGSFNLSSELTRQETSSLRWGGGLHVTRQVSKSGFQDYSVFQALMHLSLRF